MVSLNRRPPCAGVRVIDPRSGAVGYGRIRNRRGSNRCLQLGMGTRSTPIHLRRLVAQLIPHALQGGGVVAGGQFAEGLTRPQRRL
jgi:hypothetical protein